MPLDTALLPRYGIQDFGHTVADVIAHHFANEQSGQEDTHYRINQIQPVYTCGIEVLCQELLDVLHEKFQQKSGQGRKDSYQET